MIYDAKKGARGKVLVNGKEVKSDRCSTGIRGWARVLIQDADGYVLTARKDAVKRRKIRGRVQFVLLKWSESE